MMKNLVNHKNILLGTTVDNEIVFANITVRENKFSASFSLVTPTKIDNSYLYDVFSSLMDSYSKEQLYDLCEQYNVTPNNLIDEMFYYTTPEEILDLSLFPKEVELNGDEWVFESSTCGQVETRGLMDKCVNEDAYYKLMTLWQDFHLKQIDDDTIKEVETIIEQLNEVDQMEWIEDYIKECYYR